MRFCSWLLALTPNLSYTSAAILAEQLFLRRVSVRAAEVSCTPFPSPPSPSPAFAVRRSCPSPSRPPATSWLPSLRFAPSIPSPSVESWWLRSCGSRGKVRWARRRHGLFWEQLRELERGRGLHPAGREAPTAECCLLGGIHHPKHALETTEEWCCFFLGRWTLGS